MANTRRNGFIILGLLLVTGITGIWAFSKIDSVATASAQIDNLRGNVLYMIKLEENFLYHETTNPDFYSSGQSPFLIAHRKTVGEFSAALDSFLNEPTIAAEISESDSSKRLSKGLPGAVSEYQTNFEQLVELYQIRGFKDFGVVGEMRDAAHALEDAERGISDRDVLMLRRHEKDYIIRHDTTYAEKFNAFAEELIASKSGAIQEELKAYQKSFQQMVELESEMGINNANEGLRGALLSNGEALIIQTRLLSEYLIGRNEKVRANTHNIFLVVTALSFLLGLFFQIKK